MTISTEMIPFHGDSLLYVERNGMPFFGIRRACAHLGIADRPQIQKLQARPELWGATIIVAPSAGGEQETFCIPQGRVAAWLFSITPSKVAEPLRELLTRYQIEAADVLDRHFRLRSEAKDAEIERLRMQHEACAAFATAFNPTWSRIAALQRSGTARSELKKYFPGKPAWEVLQITEEMEKVGAIQRDGWGRVKLVHPDAAEPFQAGRPATVTEH